MSQCKLPLNIDCIKNTRESYDKEIVNFIESTREKEENEETVDTKELEKIDELLVDHYKATLILNDELNTFENNKFAEKAIDINGDYLDCMKELSIEISK